MLGTSASSIDLAEDRERWNVLCGEAGHPAAPGGDGDHTERGGRNGRVDRVPGAGPPSTCWVGGQWRSSTTTTVGGRGRGGRDRWSHGPRGRGDRRATGPGRPVPRRRGGGRRRLGARTRRRGARLRGHGTCRGGRGPLGGFGLRLPPQTLRPGGGELERHTRPSPRRSRSAASQRAVRGEGRSGVRARGQPAGQPDRPFVAKATGVPVAMVAARVMVGATLAELRARACWSSR